MANAIALDPRTGGGAAYRWRHAGRDFSLSAQATGPAVPLVPGSEAEFITEHYWGYTRQRDGGTLEYEVAHPPWQVWNAATSRFDGPAARLYGDAFAAVLAGPPRSAFVAVGSAVQVYSGR